MMYFGGGGGGGGALCVRTYDNARRRINVTEA